MLAKRWLRSLAFVLVTVTALVSCGGSRAWLDLNPEPDINAPTFRLSGSVHYVDVEGGLFAIESTDGTNYNPVNLPESYKVDGMNVEADARVRTDLVSAALIGPIVELMRIRATGDSTP